MFTSCLHIFTNCHHPHKMEKCKVKEIFGNLGCNRQFTACFFKGKQIIMKASDTWIDECISWLSLGFLLILKLDKQEQAVLWDVSLNLNIWLRRKTEATNHIIVFMSKHSPYITDSSGFLLLVLSQFSNVFQTEILNPACLLQIHVIELKSG